jgi:hypothetical protein
VIIVSGGISVLAPKTAKNHVSSQAFRIGKKRSVGMAGLRMIEEAIKERKVYINIHMR